MLYALCPLPACPEFVSGLPSNPFLAFPALSLCPTCPACPARSRGELSKDAPCPFWDEFCIKIRARYWVDGGENKGEIHGIEHY
jgi:hypothetical protein